MNRQLWKKVWKRFYAAGVGLSLSLAVSSAGAADVQWQAAADAKSAPPPAATTPARPITWDKPPAPSAVLLAPVPLPSTAPDAIKKASFSNPADADWHPVVRAEMADPPKAMPVGAPGLPDIPDDPPPAKKTVHELFMPRVLPAPTGTAMGCDPCPCACPAPCPPCNACVQCDPDGSTHFWDRDSGWAGPRFWVGAEGLVWWIRPNVTPALVTTGSVMDNPPGALGQPGTRVLFGGGDTDLEPRAGARLNIGYWFTDDHLIGVDASGFFLASRSVNFAANSFGNPVLARPFFNVNPVAGPPAQDVELVALPGIVAGSVGVNLSSTLWGAETNLRTNLWRGCFYKVDLLAGLRYLSLEEDLRVNEGLTVVAVSPPVGIQVGDRFQTQNHFYGGQVGFDTELFYGRWSLDLLTKVAIGTVSETTNISGFTTTTTTTGSTAQPGGLLALATNSGHHERDRFAVMPEFGVKFGYDVTDWMRLTVGYNFLLLSNTVRPGQQIDTRINPTLLPGSGVAASGPAFPQYPGRETVFWAQGVTMGLEFRW